MLQQYAVMTDRTHLAAYAIMGVTILVFAAACTEPRKVQLGMSQLEVVGLLGEPDRISVLDGKVLRELDELEATDLVEYRLVYTYDEPGLQIWFEVGKVTGVTRDGVSSY